MTPLEFLRKLQAEADHGFHRKTKDRPDGLDAWVDDNSSVARALRALDARNG